MNPLLNSQGLTSLDVNVAHLRVFSASIKEGGRGWGVGGGRSLCVCILAGVTQGLDHQPKHQRVPGLILAQGHVPGLQVGSLSPDPSWGRCERQPINVFLLL